MSQAMTDTTDWVPSDTFGKRLRAVRAELHMNGKQFAALVGISNAQISAWENGTTPRNLAEIVWRISSTTGVDREWLMYGNRVLTDSEIGRITRLTVCPTPPGQIAFDFDAQCSLPPPLAAVA